MLNGGGVSNYLTPAPAMSASDGARRVSPFGHDAAEDHFASAYGAIRP